jgi:hypothetical protein
MPCGTCAHAGVPHVSPSNHGHAQTSRYTHGSAFGWSHLCRPSTRYQLTSLPSSKQQHTQNRARTRCSGSPRRSVNFEVSLRRAQAAIVVRHGTSIVAGGQQHLLLRREGARTAHENTAYEDYLEVAVYRHSIHTVCWSNDAVLAPCKLLAWLHDASASTRLREEKQH